MCDDPNVVSADPAKGFFVNMLIKDITLRDAIGDLIDNSVDAIKAKVSDESSLEGHVININLNKNSFSISDNGFGMEAQVARETAFNFGKQTDHQLIEKSIGQFGIGMKRAFFKIGNHIKVKSVAKTSKFELTIDVSEWLEDPKRWEFEFDTGTLAEDIQNSSTDTGFSIEVTMLSFDSSSSFTDSTFVDTLIKEISLEHMLNINKGLKIIINDFPLKANEISLVNDETIKPSYWEKISEDISVKILAGISTKDPDEGGWYIFCNDRLIIAKNKTEETVWTGSKGDGVPLWHAQYHRFRGYVFFEAINSSNLPWNTTKTGMDLDSPYYKEVRGKMITMTRQVMELLDKLKEEKEKDNPEDLQTLNRSVETSLQDARPVTEVLNDHTNLEFKFNYPVSLFQPIKKANSIKITYTVPLEKYNAVKQNLNVSSPKDVGVKTFFYYYNNEI